MEQNTKKTLKFFLRELKRFKYSALLMLLALMVGVVASMIWPVLFRQFFDLLISDGSKDVVAEALIATLFLIMALEAIEWTGWRVAHYINNYAVPRVMINIANTCFEYIHKHSYRFFSNNFSGSLVKKVNRIISGFERVFDKFYWDLAPMLLKLLIILGVLLYLDPILGAIMGVWTLIFIVANYWLSIYKLKFDIPLSNQDSKVTAHLADSITNSTNIKLFSSLKYEMYNFTRVTTSWFKKTKKAWDVNAHIDAAQAGFMILLEFAILYTSIKLWQQGKIEVADFFLIQSYLFEMFNQLWDFGRTLRELYEALAESEEMTLILNTPLEIKDTPDAKLLKVKKGQVEFKKISFSYGKKESVIENLSFNIKPGEKIALIGHSGGGKSTLVKLLLRLFELNEGQIFIDGQDISQVSQDSLRKNIALVPQDPILFHRSLRDNIRYGRRNATDKEIIQASKMAHCHEFIKKFPEGYDTFVGERGIKLSGGQRQRVAIARAILSKSKILVLDEATSSLDSKSEKLIQEALTNLIKNKTAFIIAHRLSTIMNADRIFVLENGRIVEEGKHEDLINKRTGIYKRLWKIQVGGYL